MRIRWFTRRRRNTAPSRPHGTNAPYRAGGAHRANGPHRANTSQHPAASRRPAAAERARPTHLPVTLPTWMTQPTLADPQPGRVGWLTPTQQWRANGGHW